MLLLCNAGLPINCMQVYLKLYFLCRQSSLENLKEKCLDILDSKEHVKTLESLVTRLASLFGIYWLIHSVHENTIYLIPHVTTSWTTKATFCTIICFPGTKKWRMRKKLSQRFVIFVISWCQKVDYRYTRQGVWLFTLWPQCHITALSYVHIADLWC